MIEPLLTLEEAAAILKIKDTRTVLAWGRQGRYLLIGSRGAWGVNAESLRAYTEGRSPWHEKQRQQSSPAASLEPAQYVSAKAAKSRSRRAIPSLDISPGMSPFQPRMKRQRG